MLIQNECYLNKYLRISLPLFNSEKKSSQRKISWFKVTWEESDESIILLLKAIICLYLILIKNLLWICKKKVDLFFDPDDRIELEKEQRTTLSSWLNVMFLFATKISKPKLCSNLISI